MNKLGVENIPDGTQGKDPRKMTADELHQLGHVQKPIMKIIKEKCNDCVGADPCGARNIEVVRCQATGCPLWAYRMGKNPFSKRGAMTDQQRQAVKERFQKARNTKK